MRNEYIRGSLGIRDIGRKIRKEEKSMRRLEREYNKKRQRKPQQ